jgi:hypothetical protein
MMPVKDPNTTAGQNAKPLAFARSRGRCVLLHGDRCIRAEQALFSVGK